MELNVAQYLAAITPAPGLIIIDCNPNMFGYTHPSINASAIPLVQYLRANGHPTTPIIMAEGTPYGAEWMSASTRFMQGNKSEALLDAYNTLTKGSGDGDIGGGNGGLDSVDSVDSVGGDQHLYYAKAEEADGMYADTVGMSAEVSGDGRLLVDPTCGGTHPTDLGMRKQAAYWTRMITKVLKIDGGKGTEAVAGATTAQPGSPKQQVGREDEEGQRPAPQEVPSPPRENVVTTTTASTTTTTTTGNVGLDGIMAEVALQQPHHNPHHNHYHHHQEEEETAASETHTGGGANAVTWAWVDADPYIEGRTTYSPPLPRNSSYDRLPLAANGVVTDEVWRLSQDSTGMFMRFTTNASDFALKRKVLPTSTQHPLAPPRFPNPAGGTLSRLGPSCL